MCPVNDIVSQYHLACCNVTVFVMYISMMFRCPYSLIFVWCPGLLFIPQSTKMLKKLWLQRCNWLTHSFKEAKYVVSWEPHVCNETNSVCLYTC